MIITLKGADFSQSNIGTLNSWRITRSLGAGATYDGPTSVTKGDILQATVTIAEGYEIGSAGVTVTMGGAPLDEFSNVDVSGNVVTIYIACVTGNVLIKVPTVNINTGEEDEPEVPDTPSTPTVINYFNKNDSDVNLTGYLSEKGEWKTLEGYGETGFIPCKAGDVIRAGRYVDGVWAANNNVAACFYDANKTFVSGVTKATDASGGTDRVYTAPNNDSIAYVRIAMKVEFIDSFMVTINEDSIPTEYVPYNGDLGGNGGDSGDSGSDTPVVDGYNLFNKNDPDIIIDKSLKETGVFQNLTSNYGASGYIPCKQNDIVRAGRYLDGAWTANNNVVACFYDADKNYLNGVAKATDPGDGDRYYKPTRADTAYIRVSVKLDYIDNFMVTINQDAPPTEYIPYGQ